jgi:RHS repeat-associated protein
MQNRVAKYAKPNNSDAEKRTYYIRDAQGNVMATYSAWVQRSAFNVITWDSFKLAEQHIYGSARVGMALPEVKLYPEIPVNPNVLDSCKYPIFEGWKRYEISNHLGNVLAVISDRKHGKAASGTDIQWFEADLLSAQQYYPFGMLMPDSNLDPRWNRQYSLDGSDYRYGFNGKEGDDEVKGDDNQQDYGMRIYDPRVGRFLSVDPIAAQYPMLTPYQFASNTPIQAIDEDGLYTVFIQGAVAKNDKKKGKKEKNKTFSSDLNREFSQILNKPGQPVRFTFSKSAAEPNLVEKGMFTLNNGFKPGISNPDDKELFDMVVTEIIAGYEQAKAVNPTEKINLIGSSYGSVMAAQVALELDKRGYDLGSVLLTATPLSAESELGQELNSLEKKGIIVLYQYNNNDASQGAFKTNKKEFLKKNWYKNPIRYIGHLTNMYKKERVDRVMLATLSAGTEGEEPTIESTKRIEERAKQRD